MAIQGKNKTNTVRQIDYIKNGTLENDRLRLVRVTKNGVTDYIWARPYNYTVNHVDHVQSVDAYRLSTCEPTANIGLISGTGLVLYYNDEVYWQITTDKGWAASWTYDSEDFPLTITQDVTVPADIGLSVWQATYNIYWTGIAEHSSGQPSGSSIGSFQYSAETQRIDVGIWNEVDNYQILSKEPSAGQLSSGEWGRYFLTFSDYDNDIWITITTSHYSYVTFGIPTGYSSLSLTYTDPTGVEATKTDFSNPARVLWDTTYYYEAEVADSYVINPADEDQLTGSGTADQDNIAISLPTTYAAAKITLTYAEGLRGLELTGSGINFNWESGTRKGVIPGGYAKVPLYGTVDWDLKVAENYRLDYITDGSTIIRDTHTGSWNPIRGNHTLTAVLMQLYWINYDIGAHISHSGTYPTQYEQSGSMQTFSWAWAFDAGYTQDTITAECEGGGSVYQDWTSLTIPPGVSGDINVAVTAQLIIYNIQYRCDHISLSATVGGEPVAMPTQYTVETPETNYNIEAWPDIGYRLTGLSSNNNNFSITAVTGGYLGHLNPIPSSLAPVIVTGTTELIDYSINYDESVVTFSDVLPRTYTIETNFNATTDIIPPAWGNITGFNITGINPTLVITYMYNNTYSYSITEGGFGNLSVTPVITRKTYVYWTNEIGSTSPTLPEGVDSLVAYRRLYNDTLGIYNPISNQSSINYDDKIYWAVFPIRGYTATCVRNTPGSAVTVTDTVRGVPTANITAAPMEIPVYFDEGTHVVPRGLSRSFTYSLTDDATIQIGRWSADPGYIIDSITTDIGTIQSRDDIYLIVPADTVDSPTVTIQAIMQTYRYWEGTLPNGIGALNAYRQAYNESSGWTLIADNDPIYYGDKIYFDPDTINAGWTLNSYNYDSPSNYYTVTGSFTGVTVSNVSASPNTYTISYEMVGNHTEPTSSSPLPSRYTVSATLQDVEIGNFTGKTGWNANDPTVSSGPGSMQYLGQFSDWGLRLAANAFGDVTIQVTATRKSYTYTTGSKTHVRTITAKRQAWDQSSGWSTLSNNDTIYYGDKVYFSGVGEVGYSISVPTYYDTSHTLSITSNITGTDYLSAYPTSYGIAWEPSGVTYTGVPTSYNIETDNTWTFTASISHYTITGFTGQITGMSISRHGGGSSTEWGITISPGTYGAVTIEATLQRNSYTYYTGTLPTGISDLYAYRQAYDASSGWTRINNGDVITYGDKLYFTPIANSAGWTINSYNYYDSSHYLVVDQGINGVSVTGVTATPKNYTITYDIVGNHAEATGSSPVPNTYTVSDSLQDIQIGNFTGKTGWTANDPTVSVGPGSMQYLGQFSLWGLRLDANDYGNVTIQVTSTRKSYTYTTGSKTGVASVTCYRRSWEGGNYEAISSGDTIYYGDRLYFTATASTGYEVSVPDYYDSSHYLSVTGAVTGIDNVTVTYATYSIDYSRIAAHTYHSSGTQHTTYSYSTSQQSTTIGNYSADTGYTCSEPQTTAGTISSQSGDHYLHIPARQIGTIYISTTATAIEYSITYSTPNVTITGTKPTKYTIETAQTDYNVTITANTGYTLTGVTSSSSTSVEVIHNSGSSYTLRVKNGQTGNVTITATATYATYNIDYSGIDSNTYKSGGSQQTTYTYNPSAQQTKTVGTYSGNTGYWCNGPYTSAGTLVSQSGDNYLYIPAGTTGTIYISTTSTRCNYTYYTGTMPDGGQSLTAKVQRWNASSGWSTLANGSTIYYGDKIYWEPAAQPGYYVYNNTYYNSSHYYTVGYGNVTGVTTTNFQCRGNTYSITYTPLSHASMTGGSKSTEYTVYTATQTKTIGRYSADSGYTLTVDLPTGITYYSADQLYISIPGDYYGDIEVTIYGEAQQQSVTVTWDHNENLQIFKWKSYSGPKPQKIAGNGGVTATDTGQSFKNTLGGGYATVTWNDGTTSNIVPNTNNHDDQVFYK